MSQSHIVCDISSASMSRASEDNLAKGLAACIHAYGGTVYDEPDVLLCMLGIPSAGWNRVPRAQLALDTVDTRIAWVVAQAQSLHVPFLWHITPSTQPADLGQYLLRHGFTDEGNEPAMGIALAQLPAVLPLLEGVTIERVKDDATLAQWVQTMCAGFEVPEERGVKLLAAMSHGGFGDTAPAHFYLARLHGAPVATSALTLTAGVAGIFAVTTIPTARQQGIGAAITMAPLLVAREQGYAIGVLEASEMGYPVYARIGFTELFRFHTFLWRPA